jgi:hypothetical protein
MAIPEDNGTKPEDRTRLQEKLAASKKRILFLSQSRSTMDVDDAMRELVNVIDVLTEVVRRLP